MASLSLQAEGEQNKDGMFGSKLEDDKLKEDMKTEIKERALYMLSSHMLNCFFIHSSEL